MWDHPNPIFIDFETQSGCDLSSTGGRVYSRHSSTRLFIMTWVVSGKGHCWIPEDVCPPYALDVVKLPGAYRITESVIYRGIAPPDHFFDAIKHAPLIAHNADTFDRFIFDRFIGKPVTFLDSIHACRAAGLPGGLDQVAQRLFSIGKTDGSILLKKLTSMDGRRYPIPNRMEMEAFVQYAMADTCLLAMIWDRLNVCIEEEVIEVNQKINNRGIGFDQEFTIRLQRLANYSSMDATTQIQKMTGVDNPRSGPQMHAWLKSQGLKITDINGKPTLRKEIIDKLINEEPDIYNHLEGNLTPTVLKVLELRSRVVRASTAKLEVALSRNIYKRLYDLHVYHQAHTGRFSSFGVQIHNLPRPDKKVDVKKCCELIEQSSDTVEVFNELVKSNKADIGTVIASLIRSILIPAPGYTFAIVDYGAIEARGTAWIADETKLLQVFADKKDPYKMFAGKLFNVPPEMINGDQRQVGKIAVLGCGYGMGEQRMAGLAAVSKVDFKSAGTNAREVVETYRDMFPKIAGRKVDPEKHYRIDGVWQWLDKAVKATVIDRSSFKAGKCTFTLSGNDLICILPSGRWIHYPLVALEDVFPSYYRSMGIIGPPKSTVTYMTAKGFRKGLYGGIITENIVQAICRDLLVDAMVKIEKENKRIVLDVHDEIVCEVPIAHAAEELKEIEKIMCIPPAWAKGFPIAVEGYVSRRYSKTPV